MGLLGLLQNDVVTFKEVLGIENAKAVLALIEFNVRVKMYAFIADDRRAFFVNLCFGQS